jgi:hypothetical protein
LENARESPFYFDILAALEQFRAYSAPHALSPRASKNAKEFKLAESLTRFAVPLLLATHIDDPSE